MNDPKIARFISTDPLSASYPWYSPYQFAGNTPIQAIDLDGLEPLATINKEAKTITISNHIVFYGNAVSEERGAEIAKQSAEDIQNLWNGANGYTMVGNEKYSVQFEISATYISDLSKADIETYWYSDDWYKNKSFIRLDNTNSAERSYVDANNANTGNWLVSDIDGKNTTTEAHEWGHILGLPHPDGLPAFAVGYSGKEDQMISVSDCRLCELSIMIPQGSLSKPEWQANPEKNPAIAKNKIVGYNVYDVSEGAYMDQSKRKVTQKDIDGIKVGEKFSQQGATKKQSVGQSSSLYHEEGK